jgi:hypothetical protein
MRSRIEGKNRLMNRLCSQFETKRSRGGTHFTIDYYSLTQIIMR